MDWKPLLKAVLVAILPVLYSILMKVAPDFPLAQSEFVELVLWLLAFAVGGWQANKLKTNYENYKLKKK